MLRVQQCIFGDCFGHVPVYNILIYNGSIAQEKSQNMRSRSRIWTMLNNYIKRAETLRKEEYRNLNTLKTIG